MEKTQCKKQKALFTLLGNPQRCGFPLYHRLDDEQLKIFPQAVEQTGERNSTNSNF